MKRKEIWHRKTKREQLQQKANEQHIYASYNDDPEYYKIHNIKRSFVATTHSIMMSEAFLRLSSDAKVIFLYMKDYANGNIEFEFPKSIYTKLVCTETFKNKKNELIEHGFIEEVTNGKFTRTCNKYKFVGKWKSVVLPPKQKRITNFCKNTTIIDG